MYKKNSLTDRENLKKIIELETSALIVFYSLLQTDIKYNHNGTKIAVSDSEGNVFVYQKSSDQFVKTAQFKAYNILIFLETKQQSGNCHGLILNLDN